MSANNRNPYDLPSRGDFKFGNLVSKESLNGSTLTLEIISKMKKIVFEIVLILG